MQAGLAVKVNNKGVEAKANLISLNFGGATEGKASLSEVIINVYWIIYHWFCFFYIISIYSSNQY